MGNIKKLYDALSSDYDNLGTYEEFEHKIRSEASRLKLYESIKDDYSNLGSYDEFSAKLGASTSNEESSTPKEEPSTPVQRPEPQKPQVDPTQGDAGRLHILPDGAVAQEGFNQSTLVETDTDWSSHTKEQLVGQAERDLVEGLADRIGGDAGEYFKSEYEKKKAQEELASAEQIPFRRARKDAVNKAEDKIKQAQIAIDNNPYYVNSLNEKAAGYDTQIANIDYLTQQVQNSYDTQWQAADLEARGLGRPSYGVEGDEKLAQLDAARNFTNQAKDVTTAPLRYTKGDNVLDNAIINAMSAGKGMGDILKDPTFWDTNMSQRDNMAMLNVLKKIEAATGKADDLAKRAEQGDFSGILSEEEMALLNAYAEMQSAKAERADNIARMYNVGKGSIQTAEFMLEMAMTAPFGNAISHKTSQAIGKYLLKKTVAMASDDVFKATLKWGATKGSRLVAGQTGNFLSAAARVPFHWTTGEAISENALRVDENGKLISGIDAFVDGAMQSYKEIVTEGMGRATMETIGSALKVTGVSQILDLAAKTKPGEFVANIAKKVGNSGWAKATGYDGFGEEFLEEVDGAIWERVAGDKDALKNFFTVDNVLTTLGVLAPMAVLGGANTLAQTKFAEKKMEKATEALINEMRRQEYKDEQIKYYIDVMRNSTPKQIAEIFAPIINKSASSDTALGSAASTVSVESSGMDMFKAVKNCAIATLNYNAIDGSYKAQQEQQRETKKAEMEQRYGQFYQIPTATNEKTGQTWETSPIVETAQLKDGRLVFIVSAPAEGGQMAAIDNRGNHTYITEEDIAVGRDPYNNISQIRSTKSLDGYLSELIMLKEKKEEAARMETEIAEQTQQIVAEYAMGSTVEIGTPEARVQGQVIGYKEEGDGVVIQTADGIVEKTYEELAAEKGAPIKAFTNEELDDAEVARMGLEETEYAKMQAFYKQYGKFWSEPKTDEEGNTTPPYVGMVTTDNGEFVILSQQNGKMTVLSANGEQMTIDESEVKSRTALPLSKFLANNEFTPPSIIEKTEEVASQEPVVEEKPKELPLKADGSVDENALWTNDPAAWAEWNDQQRQDGGADSINYINKAIAREQETLVQLNEARDNEADFDKRNAIEQQMQGIRNRLATLIEVQQKYTAPQTETQSTTTQATSVESTPQAVENLGNVYNDIFVQTKAAGEKVRLLQEYMSQVSEGSTPVEVVTKQSFEKVMKDAGCDAANIADVSETLKALKPGQSVEGYQAAGKTFLLAEGTFSVDGARSTYVHERQHVLNNKDPRYVNELAEILGDKANALDVLKKLSAEDVELFYAKKSINGIANEIICRAMESAYKYQNFSVDLQNKGVPEEVISLIEKIDNEQRNTPNFSLARRYDFVDESRLSNSPQDGANSAEVSRSVLGEQGLGSPEVGERGDGVGEAGAGVDETAESAESADVDIIKRGTDFRIGKTPDSNGLSFEQKEEIEKTAGELEYGEDESAATQFSITAFTDAVGLNVIKDDGQGNVAFVAPNGQTFDANHPITAKDIKNIPDTSFGFMMADAKALGNVSPSKEWMLWDKYALMLNAFLEKGSAENGGIENLQGTWQFIADTVYKTVATNSDSQYSFSLDITRVCKKNEAVINAISEMQRRLGYGITPGQIMDIYLSTIEAGYQVPCPVCYVFSRYIRNGKYATIMINGQRKYGSQLVDPRTLTEEQKKERIAFWLAEKEKIEAENEKNKKAITKANEDITTLLKDIDALSKQITDPKSNLSEEEKASILEEIHTLDARYRAALNVVSQSSLDSWITQFAIHQETIDGKKQWVLWEDTYKGFPVEAALDMRMTSTAMRLYPAIQRYRNSRGSGAGKEITFVSNNDIGDVPMALGSSAATKDLARPADISDEEFEEMKKSDEYADLKLGVKNLYRQAAEERDPKKRAALLKKARERFASASKYAKQQSLRGGQRMWSWSDNIERLAPDVFVNLMQLEMLGGALQSYSKQLEGIKLVASMNGYVNGSLMGKGNGYREVSEDEIEMVDGKAFVKDADFVIAEPGKKPIILKSPAYQHTDGKWYTLEFDDVVGIDAFGKDENGHHFKGLFDLNAKYDKAGNILVGMNDLHIRMAMMDDRVFFIIPWHSSGANQHILAQMYDYLGVEYDVKQSQDYTDVQGEKRYKAFGEKSEEKETKDGKKKEEVKITEHLVNFWADHYENAREINGYGKVAGKDFRCGIEGGIENSDGNGFISASQAHYRELRDAIFNGIKVQTGVDKNGKPKYTNANVAEANPEWFNEIMNDEFLSQVYDKIRTNLGADGRMTSADSKSIYPYEYWDESSTYDTADINGVRYLEYCRRLGYKPKFCGKLDGKPAKDFGNFVDDKGYWKTLIDRRMYGIDKKFQDLSPVTAENFTTDLVDPVETAKEFIVTRVADEQGTQTIVDSALAKEESRGGVATVDYDLSMEEALDAYNGVEFKVRTDEQKEKLFDDAKAHYGVTKNFNAAGYMLPDGSLLDFSEANDGGNPNERSLDHRDIEGIIMDEGTEYESRWMYIADFLNEGAIRLLPESAGINLSVAPTAEQRSKLFDFIYKYRGEVILEISDDRMNSAAYVEYNRGAAPARIFRDIDGYFRDGIIPQQDVQFKIRGAEESALEFEKNSLEDFRKEYRVPTPTTVVDIYDRNAVATALGYTPEELTDEYYDYLLDGYKKGGSGIFDPETKRITIFAKESVQNSSAVYNNIFHENTHGLIDKHPELLELGEWLWNNSEQKLRKSIKDKIIESKMYEGEEANEMLSGYTGFIMALGKAGVAYQKTPSELQKHWDLIFNAFGYEPEREDNNRRRGTWDNSGRVGSFRNRRDAEEQKYNKEESTQGLSAEERRQINEYLPGFEEVQFSVNSLGQPLTEGQQEFFANSKAVDKDGNLLVLYHGTPRAGFTEFKSGWFTTSKKDAISYSGDRKGRLFDPNEQYTPEVLTAGDFRLGYMTFDSEEDRAAFLAEHPTAESAMSEREYEDARMEAEDKEYDELTARREELKQIWDAYREYERGRFVESTIGEILDSPNSYTEEDLQRAMLAYDSNATMDSLDEAVNEEERKAMLITALAEANEETEGGIRDIIVATRVPRNGEGRTYNDTNARTYETYINVEKPYEIDAQGRGSEFVSGDIYKAVEEALADEQYDGVIIRNWRVGRYQELGDVVVPKYGSQVKLTSNNDPFSYQIGDEENVDDVESDVEYKIVTDKETLDRLNNEPTIKVYRAMQVIDGKLYPPMSAKVDGKLREPIELGQWEEAEERPDLADEDGFFKLDKGNKKDLKARYNPYFHTSYTPLNDQFSEAQDRPNLVTVEVKIPVSELSSGYKAEKAKDAVGEQEWKAGVIQGKLSGTRKVILSRWDRPVRIVPDSEVADVIVKMFDGKEITMPSNVVTPSLRAELEKRGIPFVETNNQGKTAEQVREELVDPQKIAKRKTPILKSKGTFANLGKAEEWAKKNLQGKSFTNKFTKEEVSVSGTSIKEMLSPKITKRIGEAIHMAALKSVPKFIETGIPGELHPDTHGRGFDVIRLYNAINIDGNIYRVKSTIKKLKEGDKFYTYELQEMELIEDTQSAAVGLDSKPILNSTNSITGANLLKGVKKTNSNELILPEEEVDFKITGTPTSEVVEKGLQLSVEDFSRLAGNIYESLPENVREEVLGNAARNNWDLQNAIYQIPARLAEKESWTKEDTQVAEAIAEKVTDAVLASEVKMKRPLTPNEALWMLYQSTNKTKEGDLFGAAREAVVANNLGFDEGVQFSINTEDELEGIDKIIADGKMAIATANQESADAFAERINKINGNLSQLRKAAAAQREYDQNTIKEIVNVASALLEKGMLSPSTRREVVKLLNITRDAVGKKDLTISANRLMDLMIANQLRYGEDLLNKYLKTRDKKVDARGIEVQGVLDINGQQIMQTLRGTVNLTPEEIDDKIAIAENNLDSPSETIKRNAENDLIALNLAKQFADEVRTNKQEEKDLRDEIKGDKVLYDEGRISKEEHLQFVKEAHETIREMRLQRVKAYQSLTDNLAKMMKGSIEKAQRLREAEKERVEKIHHYANSDMQGMQSDEHTALEKDNSWWNNSLVRFFLKPLATFDQMLRGFAPKSRSGEGYLWNHFMSGWMKATENEFKGVQAAHEVLDAKAREVFGKKAKRWSDIFSLDRDLPTASVKFWDGGEMKDHKLTQGNLLYIYMVNKMADGRMKLRKMGITEEDVVNIVRNLDPRFIELADWLQSDFLPSLREKYNAVHEKMFGAPMAAIDNYFPIRVLANARVREVNLGEDESNSKPSTITGSIIKRTKNSKALDVLGSNAFDVILEHIQDMEHWASFAELNRDLNTLLSYKKFRNRVQNMTGIYGAGKTAWNNFRTVAEIATGVYKPAAKHDSIDKLAVNLAKGVTGAKISFRVYTAIKQLLSMPAFVSDANIAILAKNMATPWVAWNWAMENLPMFEKRWKSRQAGDSRLMQTESDYKIWKTKFVETASRLGMTPNALVDAVTVAIGARSIYETKVKQYIKDGYSQDKAEEKAKRDATILFNESQQSNEGAFLSAVQVDRTAGAVSLSVFRNSSMGYQRMYVDAIRNLGNSMRKGYKEESIEFMKKQMIRDGLTEEQATRAAERIFNRSFVKSATRIATFGFLVQFAWNLGAAAPYILYQLCKLAFGGGDDDEELVEPIKDAAVRALVGAPIEGLTGGSVLSNIIGNVARGEKISNVNTNLLPVVSDIEKTLKMLDNDWVAASNEMLNILVQAGIGVNPQTFTDIVVAVVDACNGDLETSKEAMLCMMRVLQVPQSQIEKVYIDEIGFTADKGLDMRIEEFAKRYAEYKVNRGAPMTGWLYSDETEKKREDAYIKKFLKTAEEAKRTKGNEEAKDYFEYLDGTYKEIDTTLKTLRKNAKEAYQEGEDELAKDYVHQLNEYLHSPEFVENAGLYQKTKATEKTRKAIKDVKPKLRDKVEDAYLKQRNKVVEELREKEREEK